MFHNNERLTHIASFFPIIPERAVVKLILRCYVRQNKSIQTRISCPHISCKFEKHKIIIREDTMHALYT